MYKNPPFPDSKKAGQRKILPGLSDI